MFESPLDLIIKAIISRAKALTVKPLSHSSFEDIVACFIKAFENYYVPMPTELNYYKTRWAAAKVDFSLSYGMYDKEKLIGFIIHAIDKRAGHHTAYNTGTGVIESYRGKRIVSKIYEHAIPILKEYGIRKSVLEVIKENTKAIQAYKRVGFNTIKEYKCFNGPITMDRNLKNDLREANVSILKNQHSRNASIYSWDNQIESIEHSEFSYFEVYKNDEALAYFVINPSNGYIPQMDVYKNQEMAWDILANGIAQVTPKVKINNVDSSLTEKLECIHKLGIKHVVDQYEMELDL